MYNFLNFTFQFLSLLVAFSALIVAVLINWKEIKKTLNRSDVKGIKNKINPSKRTFVKGVGALSISLIIWSSLQVKPIKDNIKKALYYFLPQGRHLVVNSKSGVIHHREICSEHLPLEKNRTSKPSLKLNAKFHASRKVSILTKITEGVSAEDAIEILLLATEDHPTSVHIYDKLVRLLGKLKRYESIHLVLEHAENNLKRSSSQMVVGSKERRKYEKAISHVRLQREKARQRAVYAAIKMAG